MNLENYLVLRLKIGRSSKPNSILAQIGICSVDALHHNVKNNNRKLKFGEETEGILLNKQI